MTPKQIPQCHGEGREADNWLDPPSSLCPSRDSGQWSYHRDPEASIVCCQSPFLTASPEGFRMQDAALAIGW
jgi:hypothetical protein